MKMSSGLEPSMFFTKESKISTMECWMCGLDSEEQLLILRIQTELFM